MNHIKLVADGHNVAIHGGGEKLIFGQNIRACQYVDAIDENGRTIHVFISSVRETRTIEGIDITVGTWIKHTLPNRSTCAHGDTDNYGACYRCGAYVRAADAGHFI